MSPSVIAMPLWIEFKTTCLKHQSLIVKICINTLHFFFCLLLLYFYIVSHYINLLSYPTWRVNNVHSLPLHSLFCVRVQNTNSFFVGAAQRLFELCLLPQVAVLNFPQITIMLDTTILATGLSIQVSSTLAAAVPAPAFIVHT